MPVNKKAPFMPKVTIEGVRIMFRNFGGRPDQFNREGDRNFSVFMDREIAEAMAQAGWNIKTLKARNEDEDDRFSLKVKVAFPANGVRPPQIRLISSRGQVNLDETTCEMIDFADIEKVDLIVRPYQWIINPGTPHESTGTTAYLESIYVTIRENDLERKYGLGIGNAVASSDGPDEEPVF